MLQTPTSLSDKKTIQVEMPSQDKVIAKEPSITPAIVKNTIIPLPGFLKIDASLILHTKIAYHYFYGRKGKTSSLTVFSKKMTQVWQAAALDDPYADLVLLRVYDAIVQAKRRLKELELRYQQILSQCNLELSEGGTIKMVKVPLKFATPYGYMAASMVKDFDNLARCIISVQQLGIPLDKKYADVLRNAGDIMRRVFNKPQQWKKIGITRQDILQSTPLAEDAVKSMGKLNEQIIKGTLRAPNAPRITKPISIKAATV